MQFIYWYYKIPDPTTDHSEIISKQVSLLYLIKIIIKSIGVGTCLMLGGQTTKLQAVKKQHLQTVSAIPFLQKVFRGKTKNSEVRPWIKHSQMVAKPVGQKGCTLFIIKVVLLLVVVLLYHYY